MDKKSRHSSDRSWGRGRSSSVHAILNSKCSREQLELTERVHGGLPCIISTTVQPKDQTSEANPCSMPRRTSGAIHKGVPVGEIFPVSSVPEVDGSSVSSSAMGRLLDSCSEFNCCAVSCPQSGCFGASCPELNRFADSLPGLSGFHVF